MDPVVAAVGALAHAVQPELTVRSVPEPAVSRCFDALDAATVQARTPYCVG